MHLFILWASNAFLTFSYFLFSLRRHYFKLQLFCCLCFGNTIHHENNEEELFMKLVCTIQAILKALQRPNSKNLLREKNLLDLSSWSKMKFGLKTFRTTKQHTINVSSSLFMSWFRCRLHFMQMFYIMYFNFQPT